MPHAALDVLGGSLRAYLGYGLECKRAEYRRYEAEGPYYELRVLYAFLALLCMNVCVCGERGGKGARAGKTLAQASCDGVRSARRRWDGLGVQMRSWAWPCAVWPFWAWPS
jgi:hypothetical protein